MGVIGNKAEQKIFAGLTDKQRVFVMEYAADLSPTRAAREAGYRNPNVMGAKLLKKPKVISAIRALVKPRMDEARLTSENILRQLSHFIFCDLAPFMNENGDLQGSPNDLPEEIRQCVEGWNIKREYYNDGKLRRIKIQMDLVNKVAALALAMRYLNLLAPEQNHHVHKFDFWDEFYRQGQERVVDAIDVKLNEITSAQTS